jgi:hypothetical protein
LRSRHELKSGATWRRGARNTQRRRFAIDPGRRYHQVENVMEGWVNRRTGLFMIVSAAATVASGIEFSASRTQAQSPFLNVEGFAYDAFDRLPKTLIEVGGGKINVAFALGELALPKDKIFDWIRKAGHAVSTYYGRYPVASVRLLIIPVAGSGVRSGTTWGYRGAAIRILIGRDSDQNDLDSDWIMTHEMVHLALPDMPQRYNWLSEGFAVYIEPIARVKAGYLTAQSIWADMVRDMPKGLPHDGDLGLDNMQTWGRIYWGGALFCLKADVEIRRATGNRLGLQDAMRGVLAAGGNHEVDWPIGKILTTADKAVGVTVLNDLYDRMGGKPMAPDLPGLWRDLGIEVTDAGLRFRDDAPLAAERIAITATS